MAQSEIKMKMSLDGSGVHKALGRAKAGIANFADASIKKLGSLATFAATGLVAAFAAFARKAIQLGSELSDIAISTGFATEQYQVFRGALIDAGGKAESMEKAITIMQKAIVQGSEGLTTYVRAFERLGLNVDDLRKMKPEDQFQAIGKAIASAKDRQGALTAAIEIFGQRNAPRLIEVFKRLDKDGYGKMAKDIEAAYGIMDAETQEALDKAADQIERFKNKATIKVGELISGEGDGAAIKILGIKLMGVVTQFGIGFIEVLYKISRTIPTFIGGALEGIANKFGFSFQSVAIKFKIGMQEAANAIILKFNDLTGASIEVLRVSYRELAELQKKSARETGGILESAADKVLEMWKDEPLKEWKDGIKLGTDLLVSAQEKELAAEKEAAKIRKEGAAAAAAIESGSLSGEESLQKEKPATNGEKSAAAEMAAVAKSNGQPIKSSSGTIGTVRGSNSRYGSRFGAMPTMADRERMAGLNLAGNDPLSGRRPGAGQRPKAKRLRY